MYIGNVKNGDYSHTYCPRCGDILIKRGWLELEKNRLIDGACPKCGEKIKGMWR